MLLGFCISYTLIQTATHDILSEGIREETNELNSEDRIEEQRWREREIIKEV